MKIKPNGLFHTPESQEALQEWIERLSSSEKTLAYIVMGMTWNLAAKLTNENQETDE